MRISSDGKYNSSIESTLAVISGKWKGEILWYLNIETKRFGELRKLLQGVTERVLVQQLRELEEDGLIERKVYAEILPKVEYSVTDYGRAVKPLLNMMCKLGTDYQHMPQCHIEE